jgi:hypothetical protein
MRLGMDVETSGRGDLSGGQRSRSMLRAARGKGLAGLGRGRGLQYVQLSVRLPAAACRFRRLG